MENITLSKSDFVHLFPEARKALGCEWRSGIVDMQKVGLHSGIVDLTNAFGCFATVSATLGDHQALAGCFDVSQKNGRSGNIIEEFGKGMGGF